MIKEFCAENYTSIPLAIAKERTGSNYAIT